MSTTAALTSAAAHPQGLFASAASSASSSSSEAASSSISVASSRQQQQQQRGSLAADSPWPMAVEALAQRLWDCGRDALQLSRQQQQRRRRSASPCESRLVPNDEDEDDVGVGAAGLCDGPYVRVDLGGPEEEEEEEELAPPAPRPPATATTRHMHCLQPRSNPFKPMLRRDASRVASPTATPLLTRANSGDSSVSARSAHGPSPSPSVCTHCKRGNFLEFCFVADRCRCSCHNECPCNPRGDYCYGIARNNGISYAQFLRQNPGIDCTRLRAGQSICLIPLSYPGGWDGGWDAGDADYDRFGGSRDRTKGLGVASPCKAYTVKEGDLCTLIAEDHKITVDKLVEFNKMLPSWKGCRQLAVGQNICVE
ncbi:hypothetical protein GGI04_001967 [Coemansia thaxteri]|nr:hypothetical protein GGI04_001967 [Coemansia thaxteri]